MSCEDPYKDAEAAAGRPAAQPRKVAILGSASTALHSDPTQDDKSWEIWSIGLYDRGDAARLFEMHADPVILRAEDGGRLARLQQADCPVYMQRAWPEIPHSVAYPKASIRADLDMPDMDVFAGTACYMAAMAVTELAAGDVIGLFGLELLMDSAHGDQRPAMWALRMAAKMRGIKVGIAPESTLFRGRDYGADTDTGLTVEAIEATRAEYERQRDAARVAQHTYNGALQAVDHILDLARHAAKGGKVIS